MSTVIADKKISAPIRTERKHAELPECMRIETGEQLIAYIEKAIDEDDGTRYTTEDIERHFRERYGVDLGKLRHKV